MKCFRIQVCHLNSYLYLYSKPHLYSVFQQYLNISINTANQRQHPDYYPAGIIKCTKQTIKVRRQKKKYRVLLLPLLPLTPKVQLLERRILSLAILTSLVSSHTSTFPCAFPPPLSSNKKAELHFPLGTAAPFTEVMRRSTLRNRAHHDGGGGPLSPPPRGGVAPPQALPGNRPEPALLLRQPPGAQRGRAERSNCPRWLAESCGTTLPREADRLSFSHRTSHPGDRVWL